MVMAKFRKRPVKHRVNTCFYDKDVEDMDACAKYLKCSRSELLEYAFHFWTSANLDTVERARRDYGLL